MDVDVDDAEVEEVNEDDKDTDVDEGVAVEVRVGVDEGGVAEVVVVADAGDVRPPYVQSEFNGICEKDAEMRRIPNELNVPNSEYTQPSHRSKQ